MIKELIQLEHGDLDWKTWASGTLYFIFKQICYGVDAGLENSINLKQLMEFKLPADLELKTYESSAKKLLLSHSESELGEISKLIFSLAKNYPSNSCCFFSVLYEKLKKRALKSSFKEILTPGSGIKIENERLFTTTQYFTDDYMARHLTRVSLKESNGEAKIVDVACGGGNFLTIALEEVFKQECLNRECHAPSFIIEELLSHKLIGFDIDQSMVELSKISLYTKGCTLANRLLNSVPNMQVYESQYGFYGIKNKLELGVDVKKTNTQSTIFLTNPPFAGKRDITEDLREYLKSKFPLSNGDMCVSFLQNMMSIMHQSDVLGVVIQRSWMNLKSFSKFREMFLNGYKLTHCIDLGAGAFKEISGEKASVALVTINKSKVNERYKTKFVDLSCLTYEEKEKVINYGNMTNLTVNVDLKQLNINGDNSFKYQLGNTLLDILKKNNSYRDFATPMQGTSTGDHKKFIDFIWKRKDDKEWKPVSKGGGYCQWFGLNHYCIRWGDDGEFIREHKGSALRNVDKLDKTQLVYSDTGTLGLNVRLKIEGQIFVASGPGIYVKEGDVYSHLAYLNSILASYLIRNFSPKLTVAAGYIGMLPMTREIAFDEELSELSQQIIRLKKIKHSYLVNDYLYDFNNCNTLDSELIETVLSNIICDVERASNICQLDEKVNCRVFELLDLPLEEVQKIYKRMYPKNYVSSKPITIKDLDKIMSSSLNEATEFKGCKTKGNVLGHDNIIGFLTAQYGVDVSIILRLLTENVKDLTQTIRLYLDDLLHKVTLKCMRFNNVSNWSPSKMHINDILIESQKYFPNIQEECEKYLKVSFTKWLSKRLLDVHLVVFKGAPILHFNEEFLELK